MKELINIVNEMRNSSLQNYIVPGIKSSLIGGNGFGMVRLFECSRNHQEHIVPHSHRFDFTCLVLSGSVTNTIYKPVYSMTGEQYAVSAMIYKSIGCYEKQFSSVDYFSLESSQYKAGETYSMKSNEIHSIKFSDGAKVLFFEGPELTKETTILEPYVDGKVVPTLKTEDWMFTKIKATGEHTPKAGSDIE